MTNAVILLVLALGKVLKCNKFLLEPEDIPSTVPQRQQDGDKSPSMRDPHRTSKFVRNVDIYPGLAYFACASNMLGSHIGGNDLIHAQAFLLAGLYLG
jgi:hypothetical protein